MAAEHDLVFCARDVDYQVERYGERDVGRYRDKVERLGIAVAPERGWQIRGLLRRVAYDVIFFEHYLLADTYLDEARARQPQARIVVDTVDVAYKRLLSKAVSTGRRADFIEARTVKRKELSIYAKSDLVIAISEADQAILLAEGKRLAVEVIPLIHRIGALSAKIRTGGCRLMFVGNFGHVANSDAIIYFCHEVLPLIRGALPDVHLSIIGNFPPEAVSNLAGANVEVLGYVPEIVPFYESSDICVAPLTWGGGLKGKIAEAMFYGVPVVSTTIGIEGFRSHARRERNGR